MAKSLHTSLPVEWWPWYNNVLKFIFTFIAAKENNVLLFVVFELNVKNF